ncbi:peptidase M13 [Enterococcus canis]|uniref:Peptidase M13 n=1 Tax=Enterococcus canis TaxID=214095 RepID=A0A1L8RC69_9ENTE|nr:peptidase M13 [Enterococcus canis]
MVRLQDDFYEAINEAWLKQAKIPADKPATGGFQELVVGIEELLMGDFNPYLQGDYPASMRDFAEFYRLAADQETRNQLGATPAQPLLERITALKNLQDWNAQLADWLLSGLALPFFVAVEPDMKNAQINILAAYAPNLILPDKTYYEEGRTDGQQLLTVYQDMMTELLPHFGFTTAQQIVADAVAFDRLLVPYVNSAEENADYAKLYHPRTVAEFAGYSHNLDLQALLQGLVGNPDKINVTEPRFFEAIDEIINEENFALLKNWLIVNTVGMLPRLLSEELRQLGNRYQLALSGSQEAPSAEKAAYYLATGVFDQVVGDYYGRRYFGEKAKKDVTHMVQQMIQVYQNRLEKLAWLGAETRQKAITKLNHLAIQVGYPDKIEPLFERFQTKAATEGGTLFENALTFGRINREYQFSKWNQPVDREEWEMSADTVNAYYHPFKNSIVFPAAILQAPFYSLEQSASANYGGIGAVIAHEISHAFDNNGASFDEYGNLNNWWTAEDLEHFKALAQQMIDEFEGLPIAGGQVNGKLTVSENIADAGGLSCALEAAKRENGDVAAFFTNWATIWRTKATPEYQQLLLSVDVHAPAKLRANIQPQNLEDFFQIFDIQPGDAMYRAPEKRVHIW